MRDFPSCYGDTCVHISDSSSGGRRNGQNSATCVYRSKFCGEPCLITITWSKNLMGQSLSLRVDGSASLCLCKTEIKPWQISMSRGSKTLVAEGITIEVFWDFSQAKFGTGPEPLEDFSLGLVFDDHMVLLLGDMSREACKKTIPVQTPTTSLISKRVHIFGKKVYSSKAQFCSDGHLHDISVEVAGSKDPHLLLRVDKKTIMEVKHLIWKFRGNQTILVDGLPVEVFWDVHGWFFSDTAAATTAAPRRAIFLFQSDEKIWSNGCKVDPNILPLSSPSEIIQGKKLQGLGFSLILYAWRTQ